MTRRAILTCCLAVAALAVTGWAWADLNRSRARAMREQEDLGACRDLQGKIRRLQGLSEHATRQKRPPEETRGAVESARRAAGMDDQCLLRITHEPPRRVGESSYKEVITQVVFRNVTLDELVRFMHHISSAPGATTVKSLHLTAPRDQRPGGRWVAELELAYLVFEPSRT